MTTVLEHLDEVAVDDDEVTEERSHTRRTVTREMAEIREDPLYSPVARNIVPERWMTNYRYLGDERHRNIEEARSLNAVMSVGGRVLFDDRDPLGLKKESLTKTLRRKKSFVLTDLYARKWVQVGKYKDSKREYVFRDEVTKEGTDYRSYCINSKSYYRAITIDVDNVSIGAETATERVSKLKHLPIPTMIVEDRKKGTAHITYFLREPISRKEGVNNSQRREALRRTRKLLNRALDGDPSYTNLWTKNPFHDDNVAHWFSEYNIYDLDDLEMLALQELGLSKRQARNEMRQAKAGRMTAKRAAFEHGAPGRNVAVFDALRKKCYPLVRYYTNEESWHNAVLSWATELSREICNNFFGKGQLEADEVETIARSVSYWVWNCMDRRFSGKAKLGKMRSDKCFREALVYAKKVHRSCTADYKRKKILLPPGMTLQEFYSRWRMKTLKQQKDFPRHVRQRLRERNVVPTAIRDKREREARTTAIQTSRLTLPEQRELMQKVFRMNEHMDTRAIAQELNLSHVSLVNFINRYLNTPWLLFGIHGKTKGITDEVKAWARQQAMSNWMMSVHQGGTVRNPFRGFTTPSKDVAETVLMYAVREKFVKILRAGFLNGLSVGVDWYHTMPRMGFTDDDLDPRDLKEPWRVQGPP